MSGTLQSFHPTDLALYHRNPRVGNVAVIEDSLRAHSQYRPIVVNRGTHTGRPNEVLAGNHTLKAFRNLVQTYPSDTRWQSVDAYVIDVDDDRAARIVLADNRTAELGGFDNAVLSDLLDGLPTLDGTGYTDIDLDSINRLLGGISEHDFRDVTPPTGKNGDDDDDDDDDGDAGTTGVTNSLVCPKCSAVFDISDALPVSAESAGDR